MRSLIILTLILFNSFCGNSKTPGDVFRGGSSNVNAANDNPDQDTSDDEKSDTEKNSADTNRVDFGEGEIKLDAKTVDDASPDELVIDNDDPLNDPTQCLFAVSGATIGYNHPAHNAVYPAIYGGGLPAHGKRFDNVGGVYLQARNEPYLVGGGEIDLAVMNTFDSVIIPPGVVVEIRDKEANLMANKIGPDMLISAETESLYNIPFETVMNRLKVNSALPAFVKALLPNLTRAGNMFILHPSYSVKVSKIKGIPCDWK